MQNENTAIKSFVTTRRTFIERRKTLAITPTPDHHKAMLQANFALSLARIRVLSKVDKSGFLTQNAKRDVQLARKALVAYDPYPVAIQTSLFV